MMPSEASVEGRALIVIGSYISPYVRKVLVALHLKGITYQIDPIVPFYGDDRFARLSPLRRIPVLLDGEFALSDSTVICEYLEDSHPTPSLWPTDIVDRAHARWLEEFADSRMGEVFVWNLFNQVAIRPAVFAESGDRSKVERTLAEDAPRVLDYLEDQLPVQGFLFGAVSLADIAIASMLRTASFARFEVDAARWPKTAAFVTRMIELEPFRAIAPFEDAIRRSPPLQHRELLVHAGAPLTAETYGTQQPRKGVMRID